MKIVLLEGLAVADSVIEAQARKLADMGHSFTAYPKNADPAVQLERSRDADVIMIANMPLARSVVEQAGNLKFIDVAFTGVDHIPVDAAKERGIAVSNASGYATTAVAELSLCFMIALLRSVKPAEAACRAGKTKEGLKYNLLQGKTVGIVGAGHIGKATAALCKALGCKTLAFNRSKVSDPAIDEQVSLEELLRRSDIVSLHCPLTPQTRGLINAERLALMKPTAFLVNTARGPVVDSAALAQALTEGRLAGAALDVFEGEPPLAADHPLLNCPNTIVTPHMGFSTVESMEQRADIVFGNLYAWLEGRQTNVIC